MALKRDSKEIVHLSLVEYGAGNDVGDGWEDEVIIRRPNFQREFYSPITAQMIDSLDLLSYVNASYS